ncbi:SGNH hydrolase domain-containing protein, partial [bacterium]|nr:SGNH hydrolase domain-containing protein [bacterium]
ILENPYIFKEAFVKTISRLTESNKEIFIIEPSPEFNFTGSDVLYKNQVSPNSVENKISVKGYLNRNTEILEIFDSIKGLDINFIDLKNVFCDATNCYILSDSGLPYFSDTNHVNELGSALIVDELLRFGLIKKE